MLFHRLRRWPNIKSALVKRLVFAGICYLCDRSLGSDERHTGYDGDRDGDAHGDRPTDPVSPIWILVISVRQARVVNEGEDENCLDSEINKYVYY